MSATNPTKLQSEREQLKSALWDAGCTSDHLIRNSKDGTYKYMRSYYYRSSDPDKLAAQIATIPGVTIVESYDAWAEWPKTSYLVVRFTYAPPA
jgi:hypothetical protein